MDFMVSWRKLIAQLTQLDRWEVPFCRRMAYRIADHLAKLSYPTSHIFTMVLPPYSWNISAGGAGGSTIQPCDGCSAEPDPLGLGSLLRCCDEEITHMAFMFQSAVMFSLSGCFVITLFLAGCNLLSYWIKSPPLRKKYKSYVYVCVCVSLCGQKISSLRRKWSVS